MHFILNKIKELPKMEFNFFKINSNFEIIFFKKNITFRKTLKNSTFFNFIKKIKQKLKS